jgi:hypothetical protein
MALIRTRKCLQALATVAVRQVGHQRGGCVVGSFVYVPLTNAPDVIILRITVWAAGWQNLLGPELLLVDCTKVLVCLGIVGRGRILLEDIVVPSCHAIHPCLHHVMQHLGTQCSVLLSITFCPLAKRQAGRHYIPFVADYTQHHYTPTVA